MKKKHVHITPQKLMVALLVGIIAVPITSTALFIQQDAIETLKVAPEELRSAAFEDRSALRARNRLYWRAIEQFQKLTELGVDVQKPDINDPATIDALFNAAPDVEEVEELPTVTSLTTNQLETHDRALLRRYTRAGFCPEGLKDFYIAGFYELCNMLVGESVRREPVTGLLNHNAYLYRTLRRAAPNAGISGWKLRLKMIDEAYNGERRDGGSIPGRPTTCTMNPDCLTPRYNN